VWGICRKDYIAWHGCNEYLSGLEHAAKDLQKIHFKEINMPIVSREVII
jgi:hypothetical protein